MNTTENSQLPLDVIPPKERRTGLLRFGANLVLVTALMPCVSPIVIPNMDVQVMSLVASIMVLAMLVVLVPEKIRVNQADLAILIAGILTLVYANFNQVVTNIEPWIRGCAPILMGFPVYFAVRNLYAYMSARVFVWIVAVYCGVLLFEITFPSIYFLIFSHFLSDIRWIPGGTRGPNGLCPEPSMLGNMCILFVVSLYFFRREYWKTHPRTSWFVIGASILMLVITKSGTGVVLALFVLFLALLSSRVSAKAKIAVVAGLLLLTSLVGTYFAESEDRGASVLATTASDPLALLADESLGARALGTFTGFYGISERLFGTGNILFDQELTERSLNGRAAEFIWPDADFRYFLSQISLGEDRSSRNSGVGAMIQRMGILALFIIAVIVRYIRGFSGKWVVRGFVLTLFFNASMFISTLWFVIGCCVAVYYTRRHAPDQTLSNLDTQVHFPHGFAESASTLCVSHGGNLL